MVFFGTMCLKSGILQHFFVSFFCFSYFAILFIFNALSFYTVLKSVKIRNFFCRYQKRLYLCGVFKRDTRETRHTAAHGSGSRSDETADRARHIDMMALLSKRDGGRQASRPQHQARPGREGRDPNQRGTQTQDWDDIRDRRDGRTR